MSDEEDNLLELVRGRDGGENNNEQQQQTPANDEGQPPPDDDDSVDSSEDNALLGIDRARGGEVGTGDGGGVNRHFSMVTRPLGSPANQNQKYFCLWLCTIFVSWLLYIFDVRALFMQPNDVHEVEEEFARAGAFRVAPIPAIYEKDVEYCRANNLVLARGDSLDNHHEASRPYSITNYTFAEANKKKCSNLNETLLAIKYGTREWVNHTHESLPPLEAEEYPSYFVPHGCDIPIMSSVQMCNTLNRYSHIIFNGDSLSRHMSQALFMVLKKDLILGGIESSKKTGNDNPYSQCRCDGQFSEHAMCRQNNGYFNSLTPRYLELCSHLPEFDQFWFKYVVNYAANNFFGEGLKGIDCTSNNYKGLVWVLQGGIHFGGNVERAMKEWVDPLFDHPTFQSCQRMNKLKVIWITYGSQSRQLDKKFPLQTRENAAKFNMGMESELKKRMPNITIIDWWRLAAEAQTSDGFHNLADVNLVKVNQVVNVMGYLDS